MAFKRTARFGGEDQEDLIMSVLVFICIKAFEYIVRSLLISSRNRTSDTGKFALEIAADQVSLILLKFVLVLYFLTLFSRELGV